MNMKTIIKIFILPVAFLTTTHTVFAWDGYNTDTGESIEVITHDHQGTGEREVEYYDEDGNLHTGYIDMFPGGSGEITDDETGETFSVEMK